MVDSRDLLALLALVLPAAAQRELVELVAWLSVPTTVQGTGCGLLLGDLETAAKELLTACKWLLLLKRLQPCKDVMLLKSTKVMCSTRKT